MHIKTDQSYGVIPLHKEAAAYEVLLVEQIGWRGDSFWTFPKGHPEANETPLETAARELAEETGITEVQLQAEPTFTMQYSFTHEDQLIQKQVDYYLGFCARKETVISQPHEIRALRWCNFKDAAERLSHANTQRLLKLVAMHLDESL